MLMPYRRCAAGTSSFFTYPVDPRQYFVKRVIAIPGDHVRLDEATSVCQWRTSLTSPTSTIPELGPILSGTIFPHSTCQFWDVEGNWWLEMRKLVEDGQLIVPEGQLFCDGR